MYVLVKYENYEEIDYIIDYSETIDKFKLKLYQYDNLMKYGAVYTDTEAVLYVPKLTNPIFRKKILRLLREKQLENLLR